MNKVLIQQVIEAIESDPEHFDMSDFFGYSGGCGTTACIAGWAIYLAHKDKQELPELTRPYYAGGTASEAIHLMEISPSTAGYLFYTTFWPSRYNQLKNHQPTWQVAVWMLEDLLDGGIYVDTDEIITENETRYLTPEAEELFASRLTQEE